MRDLEYQHTVESRLEISPDPTLHRQWTDAFGNRTDFFSIEQSHREMSVIATSIVDRTKPEIARLQDQSWESVVRSIQQPRNREDCEASQFAFDSRYANRFAAAAEFAKSSFPAGRSIREGTANLTKRIFDEFDYDPQATQISTPTREVLSLKRGVCQDFAHLQIACLRSLGMPARYVSGYLLTHAPPGKEKLVGSDASHAWISVYAGNGLWIDFDPTNNLEPCEEHITIGWGRDYGDISPIQGVLIGGGQPILTVSVDVRAVS